MLFFAACAVVALIWPGRWSFGPLVVSLHGLKNPTYGFAASWLLSYLTADESQGDIARWTGLIRRRWSEWTPLHRTVGLLLFVHLAVSAVTVITLPISTYSRIRFETENYSVSDPLPAVETALSDPTVDLELSEAADAYADPSLSSLWRSRAMPDERNLIRHSHWATLRLMQAIEPLPADARILYHGGPECMILAYELYPRRVFLLPEEQVRLCEEWVFGREAQPSIRWPASLDVPSVDKEQFLREHRITHDLALIKSGSTAVCRSRRLR